MSHEYRMTVDDRHVSVPPGSTLLDAARKLGIAIPTLCHKDGLRPGTSCMVCVVEIEGVYRLVPSCAYPARPGIAVRTDTPAVRNARRNAVELLMSEHVGDCEGPCRRACPARMDIPLMIRQLAAGRTADALVTVRRHIALPSILGRICPAPCEKVCRRGKLDKPLSVCLLKRFAGDHGLGEGTIPPAALETAAPESGRRVAVVGAGPAGLTAAFYLRRLGHACEVFEERSTLGGTLRDRIHGNRLPHDVLDREIETIRRTGVLFHPGQALGRDVTLSDLQARFDAVIIATGLTNAEEAQHLGLPVTPKGVQADRDTFLTPLKGVFVIGSLLRPLQMAVRAGADGKACAFACDQFIRGQPITGELKRFNSVIGPLTETELQDVLRHFSNAGRIEPAGGIPAGLNVSETVAEAARCLHCDCRRADDCRLREAVETLKADARHYADSDRHAVEILRHANGLVVEFGKCIKCGLCIRQAQTHPDIPGLTFVLRGFSTRISPPTGETFVSALGEYTAEIVAVCPTGALALEEP